MNIYIHKQLTDKPWGGGNQFLKALRNELSRLGHYVKDVREADIVLFNSHHELVNLLGIKRDFSDKLFVHRIDGPMAYRGASGKKLDRKIFEINRLIADATVFQSAWSQSESRAKGICRNIFEATIPNAPDPQIFFPPKSMHHRKSKKKIRLAATGWSLSSNKGFDVYQYLDRNLDFSKYEFNYIGSVAQKFNNINIIKPVPSTELAHILRDQDIFIFASKKEACSNSLLEALYCGLPAVVRNQSSNPEVLQGHGVLFDGTTDIIEKIEIATTKRDWTKSNVALPGIEKIALRYLELFHRITKAVTDNKYQPKQFGVTAKKLYLREIISSRLRSFRHRSL